MRQNTHWQLNARKHYSIKASRRDSVGAVVALMTICVSLYAVLCGSVNLSAVLILWNLIVGQWAMSRGYAWLSEFVARHTSYDENISWSLNDDARRYRIKPLQAVSNVITSWIAGGRNKHRGCLTRRSMRMFIMCEIYRLRWIVCIWIQMIFEAIDDFNTTGDKEWIDDSGEYGCIDKIQRTYVQILQIGDNLFLRSNMSGGLMYGDALQDLLYDGHAYQRKFFDGGRFPTATIEERKSSRVAHFYLIVTGVSLRDRREVRRSLFIGQHVRMRSLFRDADDSRQWREDGFLGWYDGPYDGVVVKVRSLMGFVLSVSVGETHVSAPPSE